MVASNPARGLITGPVDKLTEADSSGLIEAPWASAAVPDLAFSETVGQRPPWSPTRPAPSSQPQKVRFAPDSPLEGGVSCELVSEKAKIPC